MLNYGVFFNNITGEEYQYEAGEGNNFGVFVFAGYAPATDLFKDQLQLTPDGYLVTDRDQKTSKDGIYGAGDVCEKQLRQVVTAAVSDGAVGCHIYGKVSVLPCIKSLVLSGKNLKALKPGLKRLQTLIVCPVFMVNRERSSEMAPAMDFLQRI